MTNTVNIGHNEAPYSVHRGDKISLKILSLHVLHLWFGVHLSHWCMERNNKTCQSTDKSVHHTLLLCSPKVGQWLELRVQAELTGHASLANESLDSPPWPGVWWKRALYFSPSALPVNVMFTQCGGHIMCVLGKHSKISFAVFQHVDLTVVAWGPTHISNRLGGEVSMAHFV